MFSAYLKAEINYRPSLLFISVGLWDLSWYNPYSSVTKLVHILSKRSQWDVSAPLSPLNGNSATVALRIAVARSRYFASSACDNCNPVHIQSSYGRSKAGVQCRVNFPGLQTLPTMSSIAMTRTDDNQLKIPVYECFLLCSLIPREFKFPRLK